MFREAKVLCVILIIGVLAALYVLGNRHSAEQRNRAVETVVDYTEMRQLAGSAGIPMDVVLSEFKDAGATSVAVEIDTVGTLIDSGKAILRPDENGTSIVVPDREVRDRLLRVLDRYAAQESGSSSGGFFIEDRRINADIAFLRNVPVGLPSDAVRNVKSGGINIIARVSNYPGVDEQTIRNVLQDVSSEGVRTVIFGGDQVLGFRGLMEVTADGFEENDLTYGSIEFGRQRGDAGFSRKLEDRTVRVHSIPQPEIVQMSQYAAVERYTRAVRERNIRLLYIRLFDGATEDPVISNAAYVRKIASSLRRYGYEPKAVHAYIDPAPAVWLRALMGSGVAAGIGLLFMSVVILPRRSAVLYIGVPILLMALLAAAPFSIGQKLVALLAAFAFPALAVVRIGRDKPERPAKESSVAKAGMSFLSAIGTTAVGGLLVAGLLSSRAYMLKIDQFAGVKLAHLVPLLLVLGIYAAGLAWQRGTIAEQRARATESLRNLLSRPILVWQVVGLSAVLILLALVIARSGNDPGMGVSAIELKARSVLDQVLYVRPRTKEFLFGHPMLFLGIALVLSGRRSWAIPFLVLGTIGQVSLLNTFCHIHTPIALSVMRVAVGAILGFAIGIILYWVIQRFGLLRAEESP